MGKKNERGSITVEASISLTTFLFFFLMLYCVIDMCIMQAKISCALNNSAKEISQYCYLYGVTGLNEGFTALKNSGQSARDMSNEVASSIGETYNNIQSLSGAIEGAASIDMSNIGDLQNTWENIATEANTVAASVESTGNVLADTIETISEDPKKIMFGFARAFASSATDVAVSKVIIPPVTRALMKKHLKRSDDDDPSKFLHDYRVVKGTFSTYTKSLNYAGSKFTFATDDVSQREILLCCSYSVTPIRYLPFDKVYTVTVSANTKPWLTGDGKTIQVNE